MINTDPRNIDFFISGDFPTSERLAEKSPYFFFNIAFCNLFLCDSYFDDFNYFDGDYLLSKER